MTERLCPRCGAVMVQSEYCSIPIWDCLACGLAEDLIDGHTLIEGTTTEDRKGIVSVSGACACGWWEAQTLTRERSWEQFAEHVYAVKAAMSVVGDSV